MLTSLCPTFPSPFQIGDGTLFARANFSIDGSTVNIVANFTGQASQVRQLTWLKGV